MSASAHSLRGDVTHQIAANLTSTLEMDGLLERINAESQQYCRPIGGVVLLVEPRRGVLRGVAVAGSGFEDLAEREVPLARLSGAVLVETADLAVESAGQVLTQPLNASLLPLAECRPPAAPGSVLLVALRHQGRLLAIQQLIFAEPPAPLANGRAELWAVANYGSIGLHNASELLGLRQLSISDDVTGLFNSRYLYQVLDTEIRRSERFGYSFSFLFLDLDHFKWVNDRHGHLVGSRLLRDFGELLQAQVRRIDWVFRYGGDEFAILLPQTGKANAKVVALRLLETIRAHRYPNPQNVPLGITASIGLAAFPDDATQSAQIVRRADELMYQVKNTSRDDLAVAGG